MNDKNKSTTIELDKIKIGIQLAVSKHLIDGSVSFNQTMPEEIQLIIEGYLFGKKFEKIEIKYPQDWLEAFKERWFCRRLKDKYPVKYWVRIIDTRIIYNAFKPCLLDESYILKTDSIIIPKIGSD